MAGQFVVLSTEKGNPLPRLPVVIVTDTGTTLALIESPDVIRTYTRTSKIVSTTTPTQTIISGVTQSKIWDLFIDAAGAVAVTLFNGTGTTVHTFNCVAGVPHVLSSSKYDGDHWYDIVPNTTVNLTASLSAAVSVDIFLKTT